MKRNSNIELLRIISMFMIVLSHSSVHSGIVYNTVPLSFNKYIMECFILGNLGVIIFMMISGYYMINNKKIVLSKLFKILFQVLFYSIIIYTITCILKINTFSKKELLKVLLPISFKQYWFITVFIIIYLFSPFMNKLLNSLTKKEYQCLLVLELLIFSLMRMITTNDYYGNELIQLTCFYCLGGYLGKYNVDFLKNKRNNYLTIIISSIIMFGSILILELLGLKYNMILNHTTYLLYRTSIFAIIFSISLVALFANKTVFYNKVINTISGTTFGIYLIHENGYLRNYIWTKIFKINEMFYKPYLVFYVLTSVIIVFTVCSLIEYLRQKICNQNIKNICLIIDKKQDELEEKL